MARPVWRYTVGWHAAGCLNDSTQGPYMGTTRRELMDLVRDMLDQYGLPASAVRHVGAKRLWSFIKRHGSSSAHFAIPGPGSYRLSFDGLTEEEFTQAEAALDY